MNKRRKIRVLIADDHALVRHAMVSLLSAHCIDVVGIAVDGDEAVSLYQSLTPDLAILDIEMPKRSGCLVARDILKENRQAKLIFYSGNMKYYQISLLRGLGVLGFVQKSGVSGLLAAVESVYNSQVYFCKDSLHCLRFSAHDSGRFVLFDELTVTEKVVAFLLLQQYSVDRIVDLMSIEHTTVKTHIRRIYKKMGVHSKDQFLLYATKVGFFDRLAAS